MTIDLNSVEPEIQAAAILAAATLLLSNKQSDRGNGVIAVEKTIATTAIKILREYLSQRGEAERIDIEEGAKMAQEEFDHMPRAAR
jgi:hypothetical protein